MDSPNEVLDFEYNFGETDRAELLSSAGQTVRALTSELGAEGQTTDSAVSSASLLLQQLNEETAELGSYPDIVKLEEEHFTKHGLAVPARFKDLSERFRFYWVRFPITLAPLENRPFNKLEYAVEFNPGVSEGHLRPRAHLILPDRKIKQLLEINNSLEVQIGENFEFEVATGKIDAQLGAAQAKVEAGVEAKAAAKMGFVAGPFKYTVKKAELEHSPAGTEKVFWRMSEARFFETDDPTFIVVLQVPKGVEQVKIAAAMQAYHSFNMWAASLSDVISYFGEQVANFFRKGAPIPDQKVWDISHDL
jgi:hypothetical protein